MYKYPPKIKKRVIELMSIGTPYEDIIKILIQEELITPDTKRKPSRQITFAWRNEAYDYRKAREELDKKVIDDADNNTRKLLEQAVQDISLARDLAVTTADFCRVAQRTTSVALVYANIEGLNITNTNMKFEGTMKLDPAEILMRKYPPEARDKKQFKNEKKKDEEVKP